VSQRTERVDELLRQEIGSIVARDVADPRVGFVTITDIETTQDLRHAKVWVSVIGQPAERDAAVEALRHAMPFIRHELGKRLRIKRIPDLHVHLDDTAERGTRILQLLADIEAGATPDADVPVAESLPTPVARVHQTDDLGEELEDARATLGGLVEVDVEVGDALDPQAFAELVPDERHGMAERGNGRVAFGRLADDADPDLGVPQVRRRLDLRDRDEPDPRIRHVPRDDRADLLPQELVDAFCSLAHRRLSWPRLD